VIHEVRIEVDITATQAQITLMKIITVNHGHIGEIKGSDKAEIKMSITGIESVFINTSS